MNNIELTELGKKLQKVLKLSDWNIHYSFVDADKLEKDTIAQLEKCLADEKMALILIDNEYEKEIGHEKLLTLEHIVLHELTHIIIYKHVEDLPNKIKNHKKVVEMEEYICNITSSIIYNLIKEKQYV